MRQATKKRQQDDQLNPFRTPKAISPYHQDPQPPVNQNRPFRHVYQGLMYKILSIPIGHLGGHSIPIEPASVLSILQPEDTPSVEDKEVADIQRKTTLNGSPRENGSPRSPFEWYLQSTTPLVHSASVQSLTRSESNGTFEIDTTNFVQSTPTTTQDGNNPTARFPKNKVFTFAQPSLGLHYPQTQLKIPKSVSLDYKSPSTIIIQTDDKAKPVRITFPQEGDTVEENDHHIIINRQHETSTIMVQQTGEDRKEYNEITYGGSLLRIRSNTDMANELTIVLEQPQEKTSQYALIPTEDNSDLKGLIERTDGCQVTSCQHKSMNPHTEAVGLPMIAFMKRYNLKRFDKLTDDQKLTLTNSRFEYLAGLVYQTAAFQDEVTLQLTADLIMAIFHMDDILDCRDEAKVSKKQKLTLIEKSSAVWDNPDEYATITEGIPERSDLKQSVDALHNLRERLTALLKGNHPSTCADTLMTPITKTLKSYLWETEHEQDDFRPQDEAGLEAVRESRRKTTAINFFCHLGFALIGNPPIIELRLFQTALSQANDLVGSDNDRISHLKETLEGNAGRNIISARRCLTEYKTENGSDTNTIEDPFEAEHKWRETTANKFQTNITQLINNARGIADETEKKHSLECIMLLINWVNGNIIWSALSARYRYLLESIIKNGDHKVGLANEVLIDELKAYTESLTGASIFWRCLPCLVGLSSRP